MFLTLLIYCLIYKFNEKDQDHRQFVYTTRAQKPRQRLDIRSINIEAQDLSRWTEAPLHPRPMGPSFGKAHSGDGEAGLENEKAPNGVEKGGRLGMSLANPMVLIVFLGPTRKHDYELNFIPPQRY